MVAKVAKKDRVKVRQLFTYGHRHLSDLRTNLFAQP